MNFDPLNVIIFGIIALGLLIIAAKMSFKADKTRYSETAQTIVNVVGIVFVVVVALGLGSVLFLGEEALSVLRSVFGAA